MNFPGDHIAISLYVAYSVKRTARSASNVGQSMINPGASSIAVKRAEFS